MREQQLDIYLLCGFITIGLTKNTGLMIKLFLILILQSLNVSAQEESSYSKLQTKQIPLFEYGFFIGGLSMADYPASDEVRFRSLPLPVIRYHGHLFRSDEQDGTRFRLINNYHIDFDLSFGGSFPTDTGNNQARLGMPELDWTGEIGPRLLYYFYRNKSDAQIRLGLPVRTSFSTDFIRSKSVGYIVAPTFQIDKYNFLVESLSLYFNITWTFIDKNQARYFYQIDPIYSNSTRAAYDAKAGHLSYDLDLAFKYRWNKKTLLLATRYTDFSGSANNQSYLHRTSVNWSTFIGFSWILGESEETVDVY